jgi:hypothetical protein
MYTDAEWPNVFQEMGHSMKRYDAYQPLLSLGSPLLDDGVLPGQIPRSEEAELADFSRHGSSGAGTLFDSHDQDRDFAPSASSTSVGEHKSAAGQRRAEIPGLFSLFSSPSRPFAAFPATTVPLFPAVSATSGVRFTLPSTRLRRRTTVRVCFFDRCCF